MTAEEIRRIICETTLANGGHMASSLGAVEIAMALADVFDPMHDRVIWDVGHQAYAWKLLTGRAEKFSTLRRFGGLSGFPNPRKLLPRMSRGRFGNCCPVTAIWMFAFC